MILEFSIENYRSFKDKCTLSMVAESSKSKPDNVFEHTMANGDTVRLLKSAVLYGANASGKTNVLKAFWSLRSMILNLKRAGESIDYYAPFLFDVATSESPTNFNLSFIGPHNFKYIYNITFNGEEILEETLDYYPKSQIRNLFTRLADINSDGLIQTVKLGQDFNNKTLKVIKNQTVLSKFGGEEPDEFLTPIYLYFRNNLTIVGNTNLGHVKNAIENKVYQNIDLWKRLNKLIQISDTKIEDIEIRKNESSVSKASLPKFETFGKHSVYGEEGKLYEAELPMKEESKGTNVLFLLGAEILDKLNKGGIFVVDEIDTSLHPMLAKFLVMLFQHTRSNPHNAQLIFTTHETTFLDKDIFRKDQIWFTEKNEYGATELLSVQEFDKVREDTPFEKWYLAGKFGGIPNIREIKYIFQDDEA